MKVLVETPRARNQDSMLVDNTEGDRLGDPLEFQSLRPRPDNDAFDSSPKTRPDVDGRCIGAFGNLDGRPGISSYMRADSEARSGYRVSVLVDDRDRDVLCGLRDSARRLGDEGDRRQAKSEKASGCDHCAIRCGAHRRMQSTAESAPRHDENSPRIPGPDLQRVDCRREMCMVTFPRFEGHQRCGQYDRRGLCDPTTETYLHCRAES